jgi:hypothetical protein
MDIGNLKNLLSNSYKDKKLQDHQLNGLVRDDDLSGTRVQVYVNPLTNEAQVVHRGTSGVQDLFTDAALGVGLLKNTNRYKHARKIQRQAEKKYDVTDTVGHSLGAGIAEEVGRGGKTKITTLNKPVGLHNVNKTVRKNEYDIKTSFDPISLFRGYQKGKKAKVIKSKT